MLLGRDKVATSDTVMLNVYNLLNAVYNYVEKTR